MRWIKILCAFFAACLLLIALLFEKPSATVQKSSENDISRVVTDHVAGNISLQLPSRRFVRRGQSGPAVTTYSMLHLADRSFFEERQKQLDTNDIVLFEGVGPPGTGRREFSLCRDDDAMWCISITKLRLQTLGALAKVFERRMKRFPSSFEDLLQTGDLHLRPFKTFLGMDAWGNAFQFQSNNGTLEIVSLGKDNTPGGEGENADLLLSEQAELPVIYSDGQTEVIKGLSGLTFQGDVMVEDKANWRWSDLSTDQVQERLAGHGIPMEELRMSNAWLGRNAVESGLRWIQTISGLENVGKRLFLEVMMADSFRFINASTTKGRDRVIIVDRNQVIMDDLNRIFEHEPNVRSVGIIYGGGHMPDLESRLRRLGYQEVSLEWTSAITADLPKNALEKAKLEWLKRSIFDRMNNP